MLTFQAGTGCSQPTLSLIVEVYQAVLIALELELCGLAGPVGWHLLDESTRSTRNGGHLRLPKVKIFFRNTMEVGLHAQMVKLEPTADVNVPGTCLNEKTISISVLVIDLTLHGKVSPWRFYSVALAHAPALPRYWEAGDLLAT